MEAKFYEELDDNNMSDHACESSHKLEQSKFRETDVEEREVQTSLAKIEAAFASLVDDNVQKDEDEESLYHEYNEAFSMLNLEVNFVFFCP